MRRNKLFFGALFLAATFSISACNLLPSAHRKSSEDEVSEVAMPEAYRIYELYVASGGNMTYEEWLESVRGEKGDPGHSPVVTIGNNGNWFIDGKDTGIQAQGEQGNPGDKGDTGKSAYEQYIEAHPEYTKSEEEWLDDLINGRLATQQTHTVSFDTGEGSAIASQTVLHGEKATKPADPTRVGYTFEGWYYNGEPWSFYGFVVTGDMVIEARWKAIDYVATFKNYDGTVLETQENVHYGDRLTYQGDTPRKDSDEEHYAYQFIGWDKELTVTGDMVFVAQYEKAFAPYEIRYLDYDGSVYRRIYVNDDSNHNQVVTFNNKQLPLTNTVYLEAENASLNGSVSIENNDTAHAGKNVGYFTSDSTVTFTFECNEKVTVAVSLAVATPNSINTPISEFYTITHSVGNDSYDLYLSDDCITPVTDSWAVFNEVYIGDIVLGQGTNTIVIKSVRDLNLDYMAFNFKQADYGIDNPIREDTEFSTFAFNQWELKNKQDNLMVFQATYDEMSKNLIIENGVVTGYEDINGNENIVIPSKWDGVTVKTIASQAFSQASSVKSIAIPETVSTIESKAFEYSGIESITIPASVKNIESSLFLGCPNLSEVTYNTTAFPSGGTLFKLSSLKKVTFNGYRVPDDACSSCTNLEQIILGDNVTEVGSYCFHGCYGVESMIIPPNLKSCGFYSFSSMGLKSIILPEGVNDVSNSFRDTKLDYVVIPVSLLRISGQAFYCGNDNMKVFYMGNEAEWEQVTIDESSAYMEKNVYFYSETDYTSLNTWHYNENGIPVINNNNIPMTEETTVEGNIDQGLISYVKGTVNGKTALKISALDGTLSEGSSLMADHVPGFMQLSADGDSITYRFNYDGEWTHAKVYIRAIMDDWDYSKNVGFYKNTASGPIVDENPNMSLRYNNDFIDLSGKKQYVYNDYLQNGEQLVEGNYSPVDYIEMGRVDLWSGTNTIVYTRLASYNLQISDFIIVVE